MNVPPAILDLKIAPPDQRPVHLRLPLFLLWPFVLVIGVLALVLAILTDVVLLVLGQLYHRYTILLLRSLEALTDTHGMVIRIRSDKTAVDMTVQ